MQDTQEQIRLAREEAAWFDRSDSGRLVVTGPDRFSWLQGMVSNDVRLLEGGGARRIQACILDPTGHVLADIALVALPERAFGGLPGLEQPSLLLETPPGMAAFTLEHLNRFLIMEEAEIRDISAAIGALSVQGPAGAEVARALGEPDNAIVVEADHTGSGGVDILMPAGERPRAEEMLRRSGCSALGAAAREILRIEAGIPRYGVDMDQSVLAPEAGLTQTHISLTKGCYVGQEIVARIDSRGHTNRALTGLLILGETLPAPGEKLFAFDETGDPKETGRVTSMASTSPAAGGRPIALAYVRHEHRQPGAWLHLGSPASTRMAETTELPFYSKNRTGVR